LQRNDKSHNCGADFVLEGDLVDACKPGDRVMLTGVYKPLAGKGASLTGHFRSVVIVNSVEQLSQATQASADISADDLKEMKELAANGNVLDVLGSSLAPSIYGHDWIKKVHMPVQSSARV
jgi:DNA replication licensing factor MCM3